MESKSSTGAVASQKGAASGSELLLEFYRQMVLIRAVEEKLYALFAEGKLFGTTHAYTGQEAVAVGVVAALDRARDIVTSNHRGHGHFLAYSDEVDGLVAEIMGKATGVCRGWGGSQHLHWRNFYSNGVLGSMVPIGVGMAHAEKTKGSGAVVVNFMGDGTLGEGVVYEAANMAGLWRLPVVFAIENNHYQQAVAAERAVAGDMLERGRAFGLECVQLDGNDVELVHARMQEVVQLTREGTPHWVVFDTYRQCGHSKSDDLCYRERAEEDAWRLRDPIDRIEARVPPAARERIRAETRARVELACERASAAPWARLAPGPDGGRAR